jgi:general secretion pathway protein A
VKLLNIVLAGQPELADRLNEPSLRQLKQRISLRCELAVLDLDETAAYVAGRVRIAGGAPADVFTEEAVSAIYEVSGGLPRTINVLCDNALISGFAAQVKPVTVRIVQEVCAEFDLAPAGSGVRSKTWQQPPTPAEVPQSLRVAEKLPEPPRSEDATKAPMLDEVTNTRPLSFF